MSGTIYFLRSIPYTCDLTLFRDINDDGQQCQGSKVKTVLSFVPRGIKELDQGIAISNVRDEYVFNKASVMVSRGKHTMVDPLHIWYCSCIFVCIRQAPCSNEYYLFSPIDHPTAFNLSSTFTTNIMCHCKLDCHDDCRLCTIQTLWSACHLKFGDNMTAMLHFSHMWGDVSFSAFHNLHTRSLTFFFMP